MQKETRFKQRVVKFLKDLPRCWGVKTQMVSLRGIPDLLYCIDGNFVAIELKSSEYAVVSALQAYNLQEISDAGGYSLVVFPENWDKVKELLTDISSGIKRGEN